MNVDLHGITTLEGKNYSGKAFVKKVFFSCDKPSCPVCYEVGYAVRESKKIVEKLESVAYGYVDVDGKKHLGLGRPDHVVSSVPTTDYGLKFLDLRKKNIKMCKKRRILGGCMIFHAFRYRGAARSYDVHKPIGWYFSPHFHILGFVDGYSKCRRCPNAYRRVDGDLGIKKREVCMGCEGFEGLTRRCNAEEVKVSGGTGYIFKVLEERQTLFGTAWYQLNHASYVGGSVNDTSKRAQVVTWFGVCSYTALKLEKGDRVKEVCPICKHDLEELVYVGESDSSPLLHFLREFVDDYIDKKHGTVRWTIKPKVRS